MRVKFKELYGSYQISKAQYYSSPSSNDATNQKLIQDFGYLPEIEDDISFDEVNKKQA